MLNRTCIGMVVGIVAAAVMAGLSTARADVTFTDRQNVNLMNSYAVSVTPAEQVIFPGIDASNLRGSWLDSTFWDGGSNPSGIAGDSNAPSGTNALTINFSTTRDIKTINLSQFGGSEGTAFVVETSPDGTSWTTQTAAFTPSGSEGQLVLSSAVDAQYLRLVATSINDGNGTNRWILNSIRVFGDTGTLTDATKTLDLVSGTGGPGGGTVALTLNGSVSETDTSNSEFINDALYPIKRQVLFNMGTGDGFTLHWTGTQPIDFDHVGFFFAPGGTFDPSATFTIETSMDGSSFTPALTQVGGLVEGMNYFTLSPINEGEYLRFTYTSTTSSDNRISDVQVFGDFVPEPASASLLAIGGLLMLRRKRR